MDLDSVLDFKTGNTFTDREWVRRCALEEQDPSSLSFATAGVFVTQ
jgi:hypothetical protein